MTLFVASLMLAAGFVLLVKGADWLVDGASSVAKSFGLSDLMIGLTVVSLGTSMPELLVNIVASLQGSTDIAIGNVVGSNIANTLLVLGAAALLSPLFVKTSTVWKEIPFSLLAAVSLFLLVNESLIDGTGLVPMLTRSEGIILMFFFLIFLVYAFGMKREEDGVVPHKRHTIPVALGLTFLGCALLALGGKLAVDGAVSVAGFLGASEALIGLTVVAVGTSLPEVAASVTAAWKGKADIAVGNVVGSNIFNIFWILGLSAIIRPLPFNPALNFDLLVVILSATLLFYLVHTGPIHRRFLLFWKQRRDHIIIRREGVFLLLCYAAYIAYIGWRG